jgi:hypothetical protein
MGFCGFFYNVLGSLFQAFTMKDWRNTFHDDTQCLKYIQSFI